jgi:hypothetical protein
MAHYHYTIKENPISLNDWYAGKHWTVRKKQKDRWYAIFKEVLDNNIPNIKKEYRIKMHVNSRHDPSNVITMIKIFEDTLKKLGYIIDDSPKYCKGITIEPHPDLEKPSFNLVLESL